MVKGWVELFKQYQQFRLQSKLFFILTCIIISKNLNLQQSCVSKVKSKESILKLNIKHIKQKQSPTNKQMNLLASQLSLAAIQLRNDRREESLNRLKDTKQAYKGNSVVWNNIAMTKFLNETRETSKQDKVQNSQVQTPSMPSVSATTSLHHSITLNPLNYIPYYNIFTFYARQNNLPSAYPHLIQTISALKLQKALKYNEQKLVNQVHKEYCSSSVLVSIVRAIVHVRNQKYVMAVGDLLEVGDNLEDNGVKLEVLGMVGMLYKALGEKDKLDSNQQEINLLKTKTNSQANNKQQSSHTFTLKSTCPISSSQQQLKTSFTTKLKQFSQLLKHCQPQSLKLSGNTPQVLFKQISTTDLMKSPVNMFTLLRSLKSSIQQSPFFTQSQSRGLSNGKQSVFHSINQSQQFGYAHMVLPKIQQLVDSPDKKLSMTTRTPHKNLTHTIDLSNQSPTKKLNTSLNNSNLNNSSHNSSGFRTKKKTPTIYPVQHPNQQVQIKLVMAQLTNNKELLGMFFFDNTGNIDPYCVLTYNGQKKQSTVIKGGVLEPWWKESFVFNLTSKPSSVNIQVYDKESFFKKDDFVGVGTLVVDKNGFTKVQIFKNDVLAGTVFVSIEAKV